MRGHTTSLSDVFHAALSEQLSAVLGILHSGYVRIRLGERSNCGIILRKMDMTFARS